MITEDLFTKVLLDPVKEGANKLKIISGYATSAMAYRHLEEVKNIFSIDLDISLLVGMCPRDGMSIVNHLGFQDLSKKNNFQCSYVFNSPPVHSKLYIWSKNDSIHKVFTGSANYTQNAFGKYQREVLACIDINNAIKYYDKIEQDSIYCDHCEIEDYIIFYKKIDFRLNGKKRQKSNALQDAVLDIKENGESIKVSLLSSTGEIQKKGGLNWGQRKGRNPNQAYIQLPPEVYRSDFFPPKPQHFTVVTDDRKSIILVRAQKDDKGQCLESPQNNSLLGEYFRYRLNLKSGAFVEKSDLENYGRTDVTFYKIDDETYFMDFSIEELIDEEGNSL